MGSLAFCVVLGSGARVAAAEPARSKSIAEQSALWARMHPERRPYEFLTQMLCECPGSAVPVIITVANGGVLSVRPVDSPNAPSGKIPDLLHYTIEDLIQRAQEAEANGASVTIRWHPVYGYPMYIHIDPREKWVDDDVVYEVLLLLRRPAS